MRKLKKVQLSFHNVAEHSKMLYRLSFYSKSGEALKRAGIWCYIFDIDTLETLAWFISRVKWNPVSVICWCKLCCISWTLSQWLLTHLSLNGCWCSSNDPGDWNRLRSQPSMVSAPGSRWQNWAWLLWFFLTRPHWWSWSSLKLLPKIALFFNQKKFNLSLLFYWNLIYHILYNAF